ncbi:hypothetical protein HDU76_001779, partial [Blyttiomyces sp. JEL0837]
MSKSPSGSSTLTKSPLSTATAHNTTSTSTQPSIPRSTSSQSLPLPSTTTATSCHRTMSQPDISQSPLNPLSFKSSPTPTPPPIDSNNISITLTPPPTTLNNNNDQIINQLPISESTESTSTTEDIPTKGFGTSRSSKPAHLRTVKPVVIGKTFRGPTGAHVDPETGLPRMRF